MIINTVTLERAVTVTLLKGQIYLVAADGNRKLLAEGNLLPRGAVIMSPDGASFMGGGQSFNLQPAKLVEKGDAPHLAQNDAVSSLDYINALQQAILDKTDPSQAFEASAAGGATAADGGSIGGVAGANGGFVTIDRTGSATIAEATFDTTYNANGEPPFGAVGAEDDEVFDLTPPSISVVAPDNTNDTTPTLTGTTDVPVGSTVTLLVTDANGNQQTLTAIVTPNGTFTVDVVTPLAEGSYTVTATVTDPAGNTGSATVSGSVDVTAPAITVDAPDNTNDTTPTITGTTNAVPGSTVTLVVTDANGIQQTLTATVQPGGGYSVDAATPLAEGSYQVTASVTDPAGNTGTATNDGRVDSKAPDLAITLDANITADDVINAAESGQQIPVTGSVGGDVKVGDTVTLTVNGKTFTGLVLADKTFSINVPGSDLVADGDHTIDASVSTTDTAGNRASATASEGYGVDTTAPDNTTTTISVNAVTADNVINAAESGQVIPVSGTVSGEFKAGDVVTLTINGKDYTTTVNAAGQYSVDVAGSDLAADKIIDAKVAATDAAGNVGEASTVHTHDVDTEVTASITLDANITADDVINAAESGQQIPVTGSVGGDVKVGDTVTLTVNGKTFTGLVLADKTFSINVPGSDLVADGDHTIDASVSTTDTAGNRASAADTESYRVDIVSPPAPKVTIVDDTNNDQLLRTSEIGDDQIQVKTEVNHDELVVGGKVTLTITNGDATKMVELMLVSGVLQQVNGEPAVGFTYNNGTVSWTETTPANGKSLTVTATQTDKAGNVSLPGSDNAQLLNEAPVTANKQANGLEDAASIAIPTLSGSDIDGTVVSFIIKSLPAHGTLYLGDVMVTANQAIAVADAGKLTFKPDANWNGDTGFTYVSVDNDGAVGVSPATVTIKVEAVNDLPTLTISNGAVVSEEGLSGGIKDTVGNSDSTDSVIASGKITVGDVDSQDTLNVTLSAPSTALTSGGAAVQWSWNAATKVLTGYTGTQGEADYKEVIDVKLTAPIGSTKGDWNYDVTLKAPLDHSDKGSEDAFSFQVGVSVSDGKTTVTDSFPITVEDDAPFAVVDDVKLNVVVDSLGFSGVDVSWSGVVGGMLVKHFDGSDNDSALDQLRWGRTRPGSPQSGYGFTDNDFGLNGELPLNEEIILGTFTHYNYAIFAGSEMSGATMNASFVVTDSMGRMTPVTIAIKFNHNETPNNGPDPRDIITIQSTTASFNLEGKVYSLEVIGFRPLGGDNNIIKTIYTNEQEANNFSLIVKLVEGSGYQLPQTTGNVLANDHAGADGSLSVIGYGVGSSSTTYTNGAGTQVVGLYGVLTILANGAYTYQVTKNGSQIPADANEVFSYSVRDGDGDTMNSTLTISVNPVDLNGVPVNLPLTVNGTALNDSILMLNGENAANPDRINVSFGGNLLGEIISSSASTDRVHTGTSYNKGSADQIVSSGAGNDHVETGGGNDIIYAGKTAADGAGTDDSQQLTVDQLKSHHIMIGSLSGSDAMLSGDGLLLSVDVSSRQADVVNSGSGNDKIYGQLGSDILFGHIGDDYIDGGSHNDALRGGLGNDTLIGCLGNDVLRGDEGADTFVWNKGDTISGSLTKDYIMDFNKGAGTANRLEGDQLDLSDLLDHDCSHNATDLRSLLSVFQDNEGVHLLVKESSIASVTQEIVLMSHSFDSLTGGSGTTANQVIDYMLSNNILDIDK